jgi:hypothetical protein
MFYNAFKKEIGLKNLIRRDIHETREILEDQIRMPGIVTFEEMNLKPPSTLIHLLSHAAQKRTK